MKETKTITEKQFEDFIKKLKEEIKNIPIEELKKKEQER